MKKGYILLLVIVLILALTVMTTGCAFFGSEPVENGEENGEENGDENGGENEDETQDENEDENQDENEDENNTPNPYAEIISNILDEINGIDDMASYVSALVFMLEEMPIGDIISQVDGVAGDIVGEEEAIMIEEYWETGLEIASYAVTVIPILEQIKPIINTTGGDYLINAIPGVTKEGEVITYTHINDNEEEEIYTLIVNEDYYIFIYQETEYYLEYSEENQFMYFEVTDKEEELLTYTLETKLVEENFAIQLYDIQNQKLIQMMTDIEMLEITVSVQEEISEEPDSIENGVGENFADEGEIFIINQGIMEEYI